MATRSAPHILVVNGTKIRRPVFLLGAPHSGTELLARALKRSTGWHATIGRPGVLRVVYAFARRPQIANERGLGAARVLRDAYAQGWQLTDDSCEECSPACRRAAAIVAGGSCTTRAGVQRYADATPELLYSADVLLDAFPDAQLIQVIRDGRDVVADMLRDEHVLTWFRPGFVNLDEVFPNPFLGVETEEDRHRWPTAAPAVRCALRWRGAVHVSARLRQSTPDEQLLTIRLEDLVAGPGRAVAAVGDFLGTPVSRVALNSMEPPRVGGYRETLTTRQITQIERIAGPELKRLGYLS